MKKQTLFACDEYLRPSIHDAVLGCRLSQGRTSILDMARLPHRRYECVKKETAYTSHGARYACIVSYWLMCMHALSYPLLRTWLAKQCKLAAEARGRWDKPSDVRTPSSLHSYSHTMDRNKDKALKVPPSSVASRGMPVRHAIAREPRSRPPLSSSKNGGQVS